MVNTLRSALRIVLTVVRSVSNRLNITKPHERWESRLPTEVNFWRRYFDTKGLDWPHEFRERLDPNIPVRPEVQEFVAAAGTKILDVGAGPLTVMGKVCKGQRLNITAVDPLAPAYDELLRAHNLVPPVRTIKGDAEKLTDLFPLNSFDLAFAQNCLDHSYDPALAIEQMLAVTRSGGIVLLRHAVNEGTNELYRGLHQWNFREVGGDFIIATPGRPDANMSKRLPASVRISYDSDGWMRVAIYKP